MTTRQLQLPIGEGTALHSFEPIAAAVRGAQAFTRGTWAAPSPTLMQDPQVGFSIGQEYRRSAGSPQDMKTSARLARSYDALRDETNAQYEHMTTPVESGGLGFRHEVVPGNPYENEQSMAADMQSGVIKTMSTAAAGQSHSFLTDEENDRFRAVHDVFGHGAVGRGFSRHGEEAAYRSHRQMYSPAAREAMTSETRGQNSFLNYGPTGDFPDNAIVPMSRFAQDPSASTALQQRTYDQPPASNDEQLRFAGMRARA